MQKHIDIAIKATKDIIEHWIPLRLLYDDIPGLSIGISHNGRVRYQKAFGYADLEEGRKLKKDDTFRVASMSKMFTAVAIMQLQEQGKLRLDDKVSKYAPYFKGKSKISDLSNVTIRQILSHASGLFRDGGKNYWQTSKFPKTLRDTISPRSIVFENMVNLKYSNHGVSVLGDVIKKVSGLSYSDYVTKNIIKKLKLTNTYPDLPAEIPKNLASGYGMIMPMQEKREKFKHTKTHAYAPATGFISNTKDLCVFMSALSLSKTNRSKLLGRESIKAMSAAYDISSARDEIYGLGLSIVKIDERKTVGHSGGFPGFVTNAVMDTEENLVVIVLGNALRSFASAISFGILEMINGLVSMKGKFNLEKKKISSRYNGTYRERWGDTLIVGVGDKLLVFGPRYNKPLFKPTILERKKGHTFVHTGKEGFDAPGEKVVFRKLKNGKMQEAVFAGEVMKRIEIV